jgi:hypothetical protein
MDVSVVGRSAWFSDLAPGTFFCALRDERVFGISVSDGVKSGALIFAQSNHQRGNPWLASGGLPSDSLVSFPSALIRARFDNASSDSGLPIGSLIDSGGKFLMRASDGLGNFRTFDLETGQLATLDDSSPTIAYRKWEVGHFDGDDFQAIFSHSV